MHPSRQPETHDEILIHIRQVGQIWALQRGEEVAAGPWEHAVLHWVVRFRPHAIAGGRVEPEVVRTALTECRYEDLRGPQVNAHITRKERRCRSCDATIAPGQRYYRVVPRPSHYAPRWQDSRWRLICGACATRHHLVEAPFAVTVEQRGAATFYRVAGDPTLYAGVCYDRDALGTEAWREALYHAVREYTERGVTFDWVQVRPGLVYLLTPIEHDV